MAGCGCQKLVFAPLGALFAMAAFGCRAGSPSLPPGWAILQNESNWPAISREVVLVADNQLHNLYADEVKLFRTGLGDRLVQSAIRSGQLDYFGQDCLAWIVERHGERLPIIHLGDACDFSCTGEFGRFWEIMRKAERGWVMAPGNHDTMFYGNTHPRAADGNWQAACRNAGKPMTKDEFVRLYLTALLLQENQPWSFELAESVRLDEERGALLEALRGEEDAVGVGERFNRLAECLPSVGRWAAQHRDGKDRLLKAIAWQIDTEKPWRSFVVQQLDLSPRSLNHDESRNKEVRAILLDTCQYVAAPTLLPFAPFTVNAGLTGEMQDDQMQVVREWVSAQDGRAIVWVLLGHHPYSTLSGPAKKSLDDVRHSTGSLLYVSAHTHHGRYIVHREGEAAWLELNVGSVLEWPLEYRTLRFLGQEGELVCSSPRMLLSEKLGDEGIPENADAWEAKPGDSDYFLTHEDLGSFDARDANDRLKSALLAAHDRMLANIPTETDETQNESWWPDGCRSDQDVRNRITSAIESTSMNDKVELLVQLEAFDRRRPKADGTDYETYRLSQVIWAAYYDYVHSRTPRPSDWFIRFPSETE